VRGRPEPRGASGVQSLRKPETVARFRREVRNWWWLLPLSWLVLYSPLHSRRATRRLARRIARQHITARMHCGLAIRCRINEFVGVAETFVGLQYDVPGVAWSSLRAVVDIGANIGASALWFAIKAPQARVVAVEPGSAALRLLRDNIRRNGLDARIEVKPIALGGAPGFGMLQDGEATVNARVEMTEQPGPETLAVDTLDRLLDESGVHAVDVLKLDCEGAEFDILMAASDALLKRIDVIVGEYHRFDGRDPDELRARLTAAGFRYSSEPHPRAPAIGMFRAQRRAPAAQLAAR